MEQFEMLDALYRDWNSKINVISRKDIDNLYEHHVLHSLGIAKEITFKAGSEILDFGTGGTARRGFRWPDSFGCRADARGWPQGRR